MPGEEDPALSIIQENIQMEEQLQTFIGSINQLSAQINQQEYEGDILFSK